MVGRKILRDVYLRVRRVRDRDCGIWRLRHNEFSELIPLVGDVGIQRIVDQDGESERISFFPTRNLLSFFVYRKLNVTLGDRWWRCILLTNSSNCDSGVARSSAVRRVREQRRGAGQSQKHR